MTRRWNPWKVPRPRTLPPARACARAGPAQAASSSLGHPARARPQPTRGQRAKPKAAPEVRVLRSSAALAAPLGPPASGSASPALAGAMHGQGAEPRPRSQTFPPIPTVTWIATPLRPTFPPRDGAPQHKTENNGTSGTHANANEPREPHHGSGNPAESIKPSKSRDPDQPKPAASRSRQQIPQP
jgi:hypothetical protein